MRSAEPPAAGQEVRSKNGFMMLLSPPHPPPKFCGDITSILDQIPKAVIILKPKGGKRAFFAAKAVSILKIKPLTKRRGNSKIA
jgi:hypothetical protein